jgi:DNA-binding IclR family transcriptional regulator
MKSLEKMISILDLIEGSDMEWTPEAMAERLELTRSTLYRYLKVLTDAGLLNSLPGVGYTLGPRIAELDFRMRHSDPLISASRPVMAKILSEVPGIALLCRRYRDFVLCVHQETSPGVGFRSTYERGSARPMLRGAASRIILAHLPGLALRKLFQDAPKDFAAAGLGEDLVQARANMRAIRQRGVAVTRGELAMGVTGIAAPIFDSKGVILGSLSVTIGQSDLQSERVAFVVDRVFFGARIVSKAIARDREALA